MTTARMTVDDLEHAALFAKDGISNVQINGKWLVCIFTRPKEVTAASRKDFTYRYGHISITRDGADHYLKEAL